MNFLNHLLLINKFQLNEQKDISGLPEATISELRKNITDGAKDTNQQWANALELVHKAYEVAGVQRPTPDMKSAWKQYEENIQYAVEQLSKYRGIEGDWRMSASIFHEAMEKKPKFRISTIGSNFGECYTCCAKSMDDIIDCIKKKNTDLYDIEVNQLSPQKAQLKFSKWGINKNYKVDIEQII